MVWWLWQALQEYVLSLQPFGFQLEFFQLFQNSRGSVVSSKVQVSSHRGSRQTQAIAFGETICKANVASAKFASMGFLATQVQVTVPCSGHRLQSNNLISHWGPDWANPATSVFVRAERKQYTI
jgi:hypothetical protein